MQHLAEYAARCWAWLSPPASSFMKQVRTESRIHVTSISVSTSDNVVAVLVVVVIIIVVLVVVIVEVVINFSSSDLCTITARSLAVVAATADNKCRSMRCSNLTNVSSFLNRTDDVSAAAVEGWVSNIVPALSSACSHVCCCITLFQDGC